MADLESVMGEALAAQHSDAQQAPATAPVRTLEDTMRDALDEQARKSPTPGRPAARDAGPVLAKNRYNQSKLPADETPGRGALAEERSGQVLIDGKPATPRQAKFVETYRTKLGQGLGEHRAYQEALDEWNAESERTKQEQPRPRDPNVRVQGDPRTAELFEQFAAMPVRDLEQIVGVDRPRLPSQLSIDDEHYANFLAWSAASGLKSSIVQSLMEFAADAHAANLGQEFNVDAAEKRFRETFGSKLPPQTLELLTEFYKREVLGIEPPPEAGDDQEVKVEGPLSEMSDEERDALSPDEVAERVWDELDLDSHQRLLKSNGDWWTLSKTWSKKQAEIIQRLGLDDENGW